MQNERNEEDHDTPKEVKIVEVGQNLAKISPSQSMDKKSVSTFPANLISDLSHSDEDEASEVSMQMY